MNKKNNERKSIKFNCFSKSTMDIATKFLKMVLAISILFLIPRNMKTYANEVNDAVNNSIKVSDRVAEIRETKNTNISNREGKIFYVSANGNDNNDGLSPDRAWRTINKVNLSFTQNIINNKDTILFNRGDIFRGNIIINSHEILIGSYGNEDLPKPEIIVSPYDGAKEGEWTKVDDSIWKYTVNGDNPFISDVGAIWFYSNDEILSNKMENIEGTFEYGQKITTNININESSLDLKTIIDSDLEFYHVGHASSRNKSGKELYLYSEENPKDRFDRIEFSIGNHGVYVGGFNNIEIDNITIKYAGLHGISAGTVANLKVTNCEIGYIGGSTQNYSEKDGNPIRYGNAVEIYGEVTSKNGYNVEDGFVVQNNYVYQVYDAGLTFQYTTENESKVENVIFDNNVVEYCNYNIEYWNKSTSSDAEVQKNTYINNYEITNNIMRYAGFGISQTRPDKHQSAHIKTWENHSTYDNRVVGKYIISNNIFDTSSEQVFWIYAGDTKFLPEVTNNVFYNSYNVHFGYYYEFENKFPIPYLKENIEQVLPNNTFNYLEKNLDSYSGKGTSGEVNWEFNNSTGILHISGSGKMKDYSITDLPEWYKSRIFIKSIIIDENVTHIGKYAFYDLPHVEKLEINCKELDDFSSSQINVGDNYSFFRTGSEWVGMDVTFGEEVTVIPAYIFRPAEANYWQPENPKIKSLVFKGNKIKAIKNHAFRNLNVPILVIPEGVETIGSLAFADSSVTKAILIPDSVKKIDGWAFAGNSALEKIVFGKNVNKIKECILRGTNSLKEVIFTSDIEYSNIAELFSNISENTTIYGNVSAKNLVNDYCKDKATCNIGYQNLDDYKININLNTDLLELKNTNYKIGDNLEIKLKDGYEIKNIDVYQKLKASNENSYLINKIILSNTDRIEIPTSYWDIDIVADITKIEVEEDKPDVLDIPDVPDTPNTPSKDDDITVPIIIEKPKKETTTTVTASIKKTTTTKYTKKTTKKAEEKKTTTTTVIFKDDKVESKKDNSIWIIIGSIIIFGIVVISVFYGFKNKEN